MLAACSQAPGRDAGADREHPTVVSLNPCSDAVLAEIADPGQLLAISHYSHNPASSSMDMEQARRFRAVSGSLEEVLALRPDVVVAGAFLPPTTAAAFAELDVPVLAMPIASSIDEAREQIMKLARLVGHPQRGRALNARIDEALKQAAPDDAERVSAVVWQAGGIVPGSDTLVADLLRHTGFASFSASRGLRQADHLPLEVMLADPPRVILTGGDRRSNEDRLLSHPALDALSDTRRERFDPSLLWCGGPTIIRAAERLAQIRKSL